MLIKQAVIVCGGLGSRLGIITKKTPKPLIKVNGKTVIEHIIKNLSRFGISEVLLLCGYKNILFKKKFHNKSFFGIKIKCIIEKKLLGTSGALLNAKKYLKNFFLYCNGDTFFDININDLTYNFFKKKTVALMALKKIENKNRYDGYKIDKKSSLILEQRNNSKHINSGIIIFSKKIINYLITEASLEKNVFPKLILKRKITGKIYTDDFIDMGIKKDLKKMKNFLKKINFKPALFIDRDGVINKDTGYLFKKKDFIWRRNIFNFVKKFNDKNYYIFVITNQSGIGRGYYSEKDMKSLHLWMNNFFLKNGAHIDEFFYAPYYKYSKKKNYRKNKKLRKPNIGMIKLAKKKWNIDTKNSLLIGDQDTDKLTAINAGIKYKIIKFQKMLK